MKFASVEKNLIDNFSIFMCATFIGFIVGRVIENSIAGPITNDNTKQRDKLVVQNKIRLIN